MKKEEFDNLAIMWNKLQTECSRVNKALARLYKETKDTKFENMCYADYPVDVDGDGAICEGEHNWAFGGHKTHHFYMNKELLAMTDEELNKYVDDELKKYNEEKERQQRMVEIHERMHKEAEYERLKKELGYK